MATGSPITEQHRQAQLMLRARVLRDLTRLWPAMDWTDLDRTYPAWATAVAALVDRHRATSAGLAAAYLRAFRTANGVPGAPPIVLAPPVERDRLDTSLRVTAVYATKAAATRGVPADAAMATAFTRSAGAISRLVLDGGRDTITASVDADRRAVAWDRVTDSNPCDFCRDLASGPSTSGFPAHDGCGCSAEPVYR